MKKIKLITIIKTLVIVALLSTIVPAYAVVSPGVTCDTPANIGKLTKIPLTVDPLPEHCTVVEVTGHLKFNIIYGTLTFTIFDQDYTTFTPPTAADGTTFISLPNIDENYTLIPGLIPLIINVKFETDCAMLEFKVLTDNITDCPNPIPTGCCQKSITTPQDTYDFCYSSYNIPGIDYQTNCPNFSTAVSCDYEAGECSIPTAITVASFTAEPGNGNVTLHWETGDETDNLGFNIYRSESRNGGFTKINDALIPSQAPKGLGASYAYEDTAIQNGRTYFYKLEDVDINGVKTMHGPVNATPRLIHGIGK